MLVNNKNIIWMGWCAMMCSDSSKKKNAENENLLDIAI